MTDRFEEAVRQAARGLSDGAGADMPTYHDAWQRGRRRRMRKQVGMTFAGALLMLGALAGISNLPTRTAVEVDDVALDVQAATSVPTIATTQPIPVPGGPVDPDLDPDSDQADSAAAPSSSETETATVAPVLPPATVPPTVAPADASASGPAPTTAPVPAATSAPAAVTPVPTEPTPALPEPSPEPTVDASATGPAATGPAPADQTTDQATEPEPTAAPFDDGSAQDSPAPETALAPGDSTERQPEDQATAALPNITFIGPDQKPDATVLGASAGSDLVPCDRDGDAQADARCRLLPRYACTGDGDVRPAYLPIDLDEDGVFDTCVASGVTACDTTADGRADTPCTIELEIPAEDG